MTEKLKLLSTLYLVITDDNVLLAHDVENIQPHESNFKCESKFIPKCFYFLIKSILYSFDLKSIYLICLARNCTTFDRLLEILQEIHYCSRHSNIFC